MGQWHRRGLPLLWCWYGLVAILSCYAVALADVSRSYHVSSLCGRKRSQQLYKKTDGAVLTSDNEDNLDCIITFQTDSVLQKFMLRFDELQLDCNDHLFIYDGAHAYGSYKADLSCRNNELEVGTIYTRTNFVTLKYVTDGWGTNGNGFRLILTAYKETPVDCRGFRCSNNLCIHTDLTCDRINHCGDNSDESSHALCYDEEVEGKILGIGVGVFIVIVVSGFVLCSACVAGAAFFVYRRQTRRLPQHNALNANPSYPLQPSYPPTPGGLPEKPPPYPGNPYPPQGGIGYSVHQGNLYYPTK